MWKMWCKVFVIFLLILAEVQKATSKDSKPKIDPEKLKEIIALRAKLNEAFEKDVDMKSAANHGTVVQPEWTKESGKSKGSTKVVVTEQKLKDVAAIRAEIQKAVATNTYAKGDPAFNATQADHYLGLKFRSQNALSKITGTGDIPDSNEVGFGFGAEDGSEEGLPNVIESSALNEEVDLIKLKILEVSTRRTREVLVLREIVEDLSFDLGEDVKEWEHFQHNGQEYFIGLREVDLIVIEKEAMKYENGHVIHIGTPIIDLESFSYWNTESRKQTGLILAAIDTAVLWFLVDSEQLFWHWPIGIPINAIVYLTIDQKQYLAVSSDYSSRSGYSTLNIYQFDIKSKEFWIAQKIQLKDSCPEITFLDTGRDAVLAAVQNNSAAVFTFNPRSDVGDHIKFTLKKTIESEGIQTVSAFKMGGYSYLALGGLSPQILHYTRGEFVPKTIFGQNFGLVEMFLPVPVRTYRDDLLLLIQHRVDFQSHSLVVLETLIWDGEAFEAIPSAPCIIGNQTYYHGVGCMLDMHRESGIKGSEVLKRNDDIFILVPRHKAESGLFQLKTELLAKNSELLDLKEIFAFLKDWVKEQEELIEEAQKFLQESVEGSNADIDFENLIQLKTPELEFYGDIGEVYVNEHELTEEDMQVDLDYLIGAIERLDVELGHDDYVYRFRRELTYDALDFLNVEVDELELQLLNGEQPYVKNSELKFDGTVTLESLKVLDEIRMTSARFTRDDFLEVSEDLQFEEINGIVWNDFLADVVFRSNPLELAELQVDGEVIVEGDLRIQTLNGLNFPDDYLWSSGPSASIVQAEKNFIGTLTANAVDTGGLINGVNPFDVVTLSENQNVSGLTTFEQLEVSERLEVNGIVQGRGLTDFLSNPSLLDANNIHSACTFHHLEVRGPILVADNFNGKDLDETLSDVVYRPSSKDEQIFIPSKKTFNTVSFHSNLEVKDNSLSGIALKDFITKNTEQQLNLETIFGNVYFSSLTVTGKYDSIDVNQMADSCVRIDENQVVDLEIEFANDIQAKSVDILATLNGQPGFYTLYDDLKFEEAIFYELTADTVTAKCDITGDGALNHSTAGLDDLNPNIYVEELILESGLEVESLHNISAKFLLSFLEKVDNIPALILEGKILVDHIHVDGDVQVNKLNSYNFDEDIQMTAIWLNRPNFLRTKLEFRKPVVISGDLKINGSLNGIDFPAFIQDVAFKSDNPIIFKATKRFMSNFKVMEEASIESVNRLPFTEIATKQTIEQFQGIVRINGDLQVENLEIIGFLNDYPVGSFGKSYHYDGDLNTVVLQGEVVFEEPVHLEDLYVGGQLNSISNVNEFFESIVYRNNICMLKGKTIFKGTVTIERGAYISNLNGFNLVLLMKNIVLINHPEPIVISSPVTFKDQIRAKDVTVKGLLSTTDLMGCSLSSWLMDTLRVDKPVEISGLLEFASGALNGNSLHTIYLSGMDMVNVVTLHTPQNISGHVIFSDVYVLDAINSSGLVNGVDLMTEMENTFMISGNQHISTPLTMQSCNVIRSLETNNLVNNKKDLRDIANIYEDLYFLSPLSFSKVSVKNVITNDLISGIDFNQWHTNALWVEGRSEMIVTGNWTASKMYVESLIDKNYLVNGMTAARMRSALAQPHQKLQEQYNRLGQAYSGLCLRSKELFSKAQNRVYLIKHLEKKFSLKENRTIDGVFSLIAAERNYLVVNIKCDSIIYHWDVEEQKLVRLSSFDSGVINEIIAVPSKDANIYLVTNMENRDSGCNHLGVNSWSFNLESGVSHMRSFNDADITMIHHPSKGADKFYAIDEKSGKIMQLSPNSSKKNSWNLPPSDTGLYRFLPHDANLGIALANGQQILLLNEPSERNRRDTLYSRGTQREFRSRSPLPKGKDLSFGDFRQAIIRILRDLVRRLNIQITDIHFAVSGDELEDEHLQRDFEDILEEIHNQKILPSDTFSDLQFEQMELSSNAVQILAARVVQVIWPVLVEIEEVHSHLRSQEHDHPICGGIFKSLSLVVRDVLHIGRFSVKNQTDTNANGSNMTTIVTRVQDFQKEILGTIDRIGEEPQDGELFTDSPPISPEAPVEINLQRLNNSNPINPLDEPFIGQAIPEKNLLAADSPHLPARGSGEIVSIKTGMAGNYRTLIAITEPKDQVVISENDSVKIYFDVITGSLFQTLSAYKPRCLATIRIQDETLLAFVEDRYTIRVLIYKGIKGFVELVKFKVSEEVSGLDFVSFPVKTNYGCWKNFLIVSKTSTVDFYEAVMAGHCGLKAQLECSIPDGY